MYAMRITAWGVQWQTGAPGKRLHVVVYTRDHATSLFCKNDLVVLRILVLLVYNDHLLHSSIGIIDMDIIVYI